MLLPLLYRDCLHFKYPNTMPDYYRSLGVALVLFSMLFPEVEKEEAGLYCKHCNF